MIVILALSVPLLIIVLIAWVVITLRAANRRGPEAERSYDQGQDSTSHVVHSGREVLKVIVVMLVIMLALLAILFGTCMSGTQW
jgi:predicted membrane protein